MLRLSRPSLKVSPNFKIQGLKTQGGWRPLVFILEIQGLKMALLGELGSMTLSSNLDKK
jgi:hypothetical protein